MPARSVTLIDADANLTAHLTAELGRYGVAVLAFADANEVMQHKDALPDLIILCIDPKRTGWAVCNRLRKHATLKSVPLIITSAEATEKDFEDHKKLKTRAEDYLHKPFGAEALAEKIGGLVGLPEPPMPEEMPEELADEMPGAMVEGSMEIPIESEEIAVEDEGVLIEDELVEETSGIMPAALPSGGVALDNFAEDSQDRTRIGVMNIDEDVNLETDAAFAAIGAEHSSTVVEPPAELAHLGVVPAERHDRGHHPHPGKSDDPFGLPDSPFDGAPEERHQGSSPAPLPEVEPEPMAARAPSVDLDLGLDQVAQQAAQAPAVRPLGERVRRQSSPVLSSAPHPHGVHDTSAHDTSLAAVTELKGERDRLRHEVEELRQKLQQKADAPAQPASGGFSREREFLNLREIINKKEKEILDLRDSLDAKDRTILDGKDRLRELERRSRDLDEKALSTERDLVAAREKIEALSHDKERVVEREKQVKGRLDDALKTMTRYEEELEGWKQKHAADVAALEQSFNAAIAAHQNEVQELKANHAELHQSLADQHTAQLQEAFDAHEAEKAALAEQAATERGRLEADHARAIEKLRDSKDNEREGLRVRHESQVTDMQEQHQAEVQSLIDEHAQTLFQLRAEHEAAQQEKDQLHSDELAGLRARQTQDTKAAERKHAEELSKLHEAYRGQLQKADEQRQAELAQKGEEHSGEVEQLLADHQGEKDRLEADHARALQLADERRQADLAQAAAAHAGELERIQQAHEQRLADEVKSARDSHLRKVQALEESHADLKMGMQQRHAAQLDELKGQHAATVEEFEAALKERDQLLTEGHARIAELEGTLAEEQSAVQRQQQVLGELEQKLAAATQAIAEREQRLSEKGQRIGELEQESAGYQEQILKAYQRIKSDESIVSRARKALAIALTLLDESAPDGSDEASS
ncbi:MAG TPA: response regulator [Polyangia bacterium]